MNAAVDRAGEAAAIAITQIEAGSPDALSSALLLVFGEVIDAAIASAPVGSIDQSVCRRAPCPAVLQAIDATSVAISGATGQIATELLAGLVLAVRRLAELEGLTPADVVAGLAERFNEEC